MSDSFDDLHKAIWSDVVPRVNAALLPTDQHTNVRSINLLLRLCSSLINDFEDALKLYDYVDEHKELPMAWQFIAAREGLLSIWHFGEALELISKAFKRSMAMKLALGKHAMRPVIGQFGADFPDIEGARNSGAHLVEQIATAESRGINSIGGIVMVQSCLRGRALSYSRQGREYMVEISPESHANLRKIRDMLFDVFRTLDQKLRSPDPATA